MDRLRVVAGLAIARVGDRSGGADSSSSIGEDDRAGDEADQTMRGTHEGITETMRYALFDAQGRVVEEAVVARTPKGWIALRFDSCP